MELRAGTGAAWVLRVIITTATLATAVLLWVPSLFWHWWPRWCGWVAALPLFLFGMWYAPRLTRSLRGALAPQAIHAVYGVVWTREWYVPFEALRTFELWTPPLHRLFRCRTVVLRFAGGCAWLPLLARQDADRLAEWLAHREERE